MIFLVANSHDANDNMDFQPVVDRHPNYPSRQRRSAIYELFDRYLLPWILKKKPAGDHITKGTGFNTGFGDFYDYTRARRIPFFIYLHPDRQELRDGKYTEPGQEIIRFCQERNIPLILGMQHEKLDGFRDSIHLNDEGQRLLAEALLPQIRQHMGER